MHNLYQYEAAARIDDLNREAAQHRLARHIRRSHLDLGLAHNGLYRLGGVLIWLGSRLHQTVCEPAQSAVMVNNDAAISLTEVACC